METLHGKFSERVVAAAEAVLKRDGSVGPLELFQEMRILQPVHVEGWRKGNEHYRVLEKWIQLGPAKYAIALETFAAWVRENDLRPAEAAYTRRSARGLETLQVTADGDAEREKFFRTHYAPADLSEKQAARLTQKLQKVPDIVVFEKVGDTAVCHECGAEIEPGGRLTMEKENSLCLACADLDHLVFLPAGDVALTRRSKKHSPLSAVVVRFSRARKRYERQGLLVTEAALRQAETECAADAAERAGARERAGHVRESADRALVQAMTAAIVAAFPGCPRTEVQEIAEHTALRGSGRVGRSAAGRDLAPRALELAVIAHARHLHTNYDRLLMEGVEREDARASIRDELDRVLARWKSPAAGPRDRRAESP